MSSNLVFWDPPAPLKFQTQIVFDEEGQKLLSHYPPPSLQSPRQTPVTKAYNFQLVAVFHLSFYNEWVLESCYLIWSGSWGPLLHFFKKLFNLTSFMEKIVVFFQVAF